MTLGLAGLMEVFPGRLISELLVEEWRLQGSQYPPDFLRDVLEARSYRTAKGLVDAADTKAKAEGLPKSPWITLVMKVEKSLIDEEEDEDE